MINATPLLKIYAAYRLRQLNRQNPADCQEQQLILLINKARNTFFGRQYDFQSINSVEDYQSRVPLRSYDQFWTEFIQPHFPVLKDILWPGLIPFYAVSSGTTSGTTKYIPYTEAMTASNTKAGMDIFVHHLNNKPNSRLLGGKSFMLGGSTNLVKQAEGVFSGDLSGIAVKTMRNWVKPWYFPPADLALLENWEEKISLLAKKSLKEDIRMLSGVPTWTLIFFDELQKRLGRAGQQKTPFKSKEAFPNLELLVHGGVPFAPYKKRFNELFTESDTDFREVYPASEGFIAMADKKPEDGLRLLIDHGIFYEFVPVEELGSPNPKRHWLGNVEKGINYAIVLSTCAGLWSYVIGDTVEFIETSPPRLFITGRTAFYLSAFGEHVIADEIEDAVMYAGKLSGTPVQEYTVGALFPEKPGDLGQHLFIIETENTVVSSATLESISNAIDYRLCERNEDYKAHRAEGFGLKAPAVRLVKPGTLTAWMKARGKLGGQNKIPRIISRNEVFENLRIFLG